MKKPKHPQEPYKPYPPRQPTLPPKQIEDWSVIQKIELQNYDSEFLLDFAARLLPPPDKNPKELKIFVNCEVQHGYYDDTTAKCSLQICEKQMIKNPSYDYLMERYEGDKKLYKKEKEKYDEALKKYKVDLAAYQAALVPWEKYQKELEIKRLTKRLKQLESK